MRRTLTGNLEHLAPLALLRLVSATSPSGILEIDTPDGLLRLEVERGRVARPTNPDLEKAATILGCRRGEFRFTPGETKRLQGEAMNLTDFAEAVGAAASHLEMELVLEESYVDGSEPPKPPHIHVLPNRPMQDPLDELLSDIEAEAPGELLFAHVGVVTQDPHAPLGIKEFKELAEAKLKKLEY